MKHFRWAVVAAACLALVNLAPAQSVDAFFGFNTVITASSNPAGVPKLGGGLYPNIGADVIFYHGLGVGFQAAFRGSQGDYFGNGVRPIFYDFNAVYEPPSMNSGTYRPDFQLGFGAESLRFYTGNFYCGTFTGCTDYTSSNHLMVHAGVGVKIYIHNSIFLRPALDYYGIRNNVEYGVPSAWQVGMSIGYTLGPSS